MLPPRAELFRQLHPLLVGITRTHEERRMLHHIIDLVDIFVEASCKSLQCPDGESFGVYLSRHLTRLFAGLRVPPELVEEFAGGRPEETLNDRPKMGLLRGSVDFCHKALSEEGFKV